MNNSVAILRLQDAWRECERNIYHLCHALTLLAPILPMTGKGFEYLTDAQVQSLDQFILRFTKLQDAMGSRLFPALLQYLQEPYEERPMLDKLNRLEKLRYLHNAEAWQNIHNTRNKFAHDYPDDWEKNAALINLACEAAEDMYNILTGIEEKLKTDQPALKLGKSLPVDYPKQLSL
ncbi:hypothetical protein ABXJ76_00725 [Methylobacter sp. G7]|uniref:hypothetical protein n=1 Tax=Methylobacter sp. G7 TaxID=3230117 RepID=UPI003D802496